MGLGLPMMAPLRMAGHACCPSQPASHKQQRTTTTRQHMEKVSGLGARHTRRLRHKSRVKVQHGALLRPLSRCALTQQRASAQHAARTRLSAAPHPELLALAVHAPQWPLSGGHRVPKPP